MNILRPRFAMSVGRFRHSVVAIVLFLVPGSSHAQEREVDRILSEVSAIGVDLTTLTKKYSQPGVIGGVRRFSERITDGEILYLLGDYQRASLVLYDLVEDRRNSGEPMYGKAVYYLAESLFQIGHDLSAREMFQEVVRRRDTKHLERAIRRLIEIADRNRRWEGLEEHVAVLEAQGKLPSGVAYIRAKSLLRQGKAAQAVEAARAVDPAHPLASKAAYLAGVALIQVGDFDGAHQVFANLTQISDSTEDSTRVRELSAMNRGRLLFELGDLTESADAYQFVPRASPLFEEALYEVTWTYVRAADSATEDEVRKAEYEKARRALEILLLSEAETPLAPEARLLLGSIHLRLKQYETAEETFREVVDKFGPVRAALEEMAGHTLDPSDYLKEISGEVSSSGGVLHPLAVKWATGQDGLRDAIAVTGALDDSETSLGEIDEIIGKLLNVLDSDRRASFFPELQDAQGRMLQHRNSLVALSQRLLAVERESVQQDLDEGHRAELKAVLAERQKIAPAYRNLPHKKEDYEGRLDTMRSRMQDMQQQAFRLKYTIGSIRAQLSALRVWMNENREFITDQAREEYVQRIEQEGRVVQELEGLQAKLEQEITREKSMISITSEAEDREDEIRARWAASLERERQILATVDVGKSGKVKLLTAIEQHRQKIAGYHSEVERFERQLNDLVFEKAGGLKAQILKEQGVAENHRKAIANTRVAAERVLGEVAQASFNDVRTRFGDIVLRADVGIVDVAWALKEEQTHAISRRVNDQRRELKVLDEEFADVLRED